MVSEVNRMDPILESLVQTPASVEKPDYTALLEKELPNDRLVESYRADGMTDEEIYHFLESFG